MKTCKGCPTPRWCEIMNMCLAPEGLILDPEPPPFPARKVCRADGCDWLAADPSRDAGACLDYCIRHCPHQGRH
jgi:hypothetical protein